MWATYRMESSDRKDFLANFGLIKSNYKLRHQLSGLKKEYEVNAADFDSPLEKSILILKSLMADPLILPHMYKELESVVNFLQTNDLLTPDFKQNPSERLSVDILSQAWLETFLPQRQSKIRNSINAPNGQRKREGMESINSGDSVDSSKESSESLKINNDDLKSIISEVMGSNEGINVDSIAVLDESTHATQKKASATVNIPTSGSKPTNQETEKSVEATSEDKNEILLSNPTLTGRWESERFTETTTTSISVIANLEEFEETAASRKRNERPLSPWSVNEQDNSETSQKAKNESWIHKKRVNILLDGVSNWNWNTFDLERLTPGRPLQTLAKHLFKKRDLVKRLNLNSRKLAKFISLIEDGYHPDVPYHNSTHATDVLHAVNFFCDSEPLAEFITDFELLISYVAAIIHDHDHPGLNNAFLMKQSDYKAILYNDRSILENHHLASSFQILLQEECNFLESMTIEEYRVFREQVIELVIATDISMHFQTLSNIKNKVVVSKNFDFRIADDRALLLKAIIKAADISNVSKSWDLYKQWLDRLTEEFFRQGDRERELGMQITPFMDRNEMAIPHSQISFMDFISIPLFEVLSKVLKPAEYVINGLLRNREAMIAWRDFQRYPGTLESGEQSATGSLIYSGIDTTPSRNIASSSSNRQFNTSFDSMSLSGTMPQRGIKSVAQKSKVNFALGSLDGIFRAKANGNPMKITPEGFPPDANLKPNTPPASSQKRRSSIVVMEAIHSTLDKMRG
ncbi:cAMP-specific 3',5'-cyclic phosphodiesterase 4D [Nowakowskiella sp. JEL0407]|nr:cAMP-specific 3',5'-cyclic phosphodiesterase 4D [Nowakowskiella sp. JEL0407]